MVKLRRLYYPQTIQNSFAAFGCSCFHRNLAIFNTRTTSTESCVRLGAALCVLVWYASTSVERLGRALFVPSRTASQRSLTINMKTFSIFLYAFGILLFLGGCGVGTINKEALSEYNSKGGWEAIGDEFTGQASAERETINSLAGFAGLLYLGGILMVVAGTAAQIAAWIGGNSKKQDPAAGT
jgi:hypothetical protein